MEYFETVIRYILNTRDLEMNILKEVVERTIPERSEDIMTLAERLHEEGRREELLETVNVLLNKKLRLKGLSKELSEKIESLDIEKLRKIRDNIFEIVSLEDIEKYVN